MVYALALVTFIAGVIVGGFLFSDSKQRSLLKIFKCSNCFNRNQMAGLLASVIVQKAPMLIPKVISETDKTIVFEHPRPRHRVHYMFIPKKDIKNIGELSNEDIEYIIDLFSTIVVIINKYEIRNYKLWTNGPEKQDVTYLHFHLGAD